MSDGPNVNKIFFNLWAETRKEEQRSRMIDLGTCGLHKLHNGFQHGEKVNGWELMSLLNATYKISHESPARRAVLLLPNGRNQEMVYTTEHY